MTAVSDLRLCGVAHEAWVPVMVCYAQHGAQQAGGSPCLFCTRKRRWQVALLFGPVSWIGLDSLWLHAARAYRGGLSTWWGIELSNRLQREPQRPSLSGSCPRVEGAFGLVGPKASVKLSPCGCCTLSVERLPSMDALVAVQCTVFMLMCGTSHRVGFFADRPNARLATARTYFLTLVAICGVGCSSCTMMTPLTAAACIDCLYLLTFYRIQRYTSERAVGLPGQPAIEMCVSGVVSATAGGCTCMHASRRRRAGPTSGMPRCLLPAALANEQASAPVCYTGG